MRSYRHTVLPHAWRYWTCGNVPFGISYTICSLAMAHSHIPFHSYPISDAYQCSLSCKTINFALVFSWSILFFFFFFVNQWTNQIRCLPVCVSVLVLFYLFSLSIELFCGGFCSFSTSFKNRHPLPLRKWEFETIANIPYLRCVEVYIWKRISSEVGWKNWKIKSKPQLLKRPEQTTKQTSCFYMYTLIDVYFFFAFEN